MSVQEIIIYPSTSYDLSAFALNDGIERFVANFDKRPSILLCSIEDKFVARELTHRVGLMVVVSSAINRGFFLLCGGPGVFCSNRYDEDKIKRSTVVAQTPESI